MTILEPTTTMTDFILAAMAFYFGHMCYRVHAKSNDLSGLDKRYQQFWGVTFLFLGIASLLGGIAHGFIHLKGSYPMLIKAWPFTVMNMGMASFYLLLTVAMEYFPRRRNGLFFFAYIKMLAFLLLMFGYPKAYFGPFLNVSFKLVLFDYGPILLLLLIMNAREYLQTKNLASKTMAISVVISILGSVVQMSGFTIHKHFNHNDLYHVINMVAMVLMYKAVKLKRIS